MTKWNTGPHAALVRNCLVAQLCAGLILIVVGLAVIPVLPLFQLDRVLTPAELHDPAKREATFALLRHAQGNEKWLWTIAGLVVASSSGVGLWGLRRMGSVRQFDL